MRRRRLLAFGFPLAAFLIATVFVAPPSQAIGECGVGGGACTMPEGCPGVKACLDGIWTCTYKGTGTHGCSACGQTGTQACGLSGPTGPCNVALSSQSCSIGACAGGTQICINPPPGGSWSACVVSPRACTNNCGSGTQVCSGGAWGTCTVNPITVSCTNACGSGTQTCANGTWASCNVPPTTLACGSCGTGTQSCSNGTPGTCVLGAEICNNCDDNNDGRLDEGLACSPCNL
jgi:hypothetical protein